MNPVTTAHYAIGFLFNDEEALPGLALIKTNHSELLNGISGLVEKSETPAQRISRAGLQNFGVTPPAWIPFATLQREVNGQAIVLHYFYARCSHTLREIKQQRADAEPVKLLVAGLPSYPTLPSLQWLVPIAIAMANEPTSSGLIIEILSEATNTDNPASQRAAWLTKANGDSTLKNINHDLATIVYQPDEHPLGGQYLWTANAQLDARISISIQGHAVSFTKARRLVETLLVGTCTLDWQQLPAESDLHLVEISSED